MTPFEQFLKFLINFSPALTIWLPVKILLLIGLAIYTAFAIIVIRQVNLMIQALNGSFDFPIKLIAWIHLGVAITIFLLALVIL